MTSQDIKEKTFEKAVFGGYDMVEVDDFLEEVAESFTAVQKENNVLKSKMKVLVEKIEEYRSTEDAMRLALLSAQKMGVQIENEARDKAQTLKSESEKNSVELLASAHAEAERIVSEARNAVAGEQAKIAAAKQSTANFIGELREAYTRQLARLNEFENMKLPVPDNKDNELRSTVRTIESSVAKAVEAPAEAPAPAIDISAAVREAQSNSSAPVDEPTRLYKAPANESGLPSDVPPRARQSTPNDTNNSKYDFDSVSFTD